MENNNKKLNKNNQNNEKTIYGIYTHLYNNKIYGESNIQIRPKSHVKKSSNIHLRKY